MGSNTQTFTGSVSLDTLRVENGTLALTVAAGEADDTYVAQEWKINGQKAVIAVRVSK